MNRFENKQLTRKYVELTLGPLRWRSICVREARDQDWIGDFSIDVFTQYLQALIDLALRDGCTLQEVTNILGQYTHGDHHGDA